MHVLESFEERLAILEQNYPVVCSDEGLSTEAAAELASWKCQDLEQANSISARLSEVVSTTTRARNRMSHVAKKVDELIGLDSGGLLTATVGDIGLPNLVPQDRNLVALTFMINSARVSYRSKTIKIKSEAREKVATSWRLVLSQLVTEMKYTQKMVGYAEQFLDTHEFN
ncbi:hypothetical protein TWF281_004162 [Arthrobotrys megalospora]